MSQHLFLPFSDFDNPPALSLLEKETQDRFNELSGHLSNYILFYHLKKQLHEHVRAVTYADVLACRGLIFTAGVPTDDGYPKAALVKPFETKVLVALLYQL